MAKSWSHCLANALESRAKPLADLGQFLGSMLSHCLAKSCKVLAKSWTIPADNPRRSPGGMEALDSWEVFLGY